jgi:hypothetical protein
MIYTITNIEKVLHSTVSYKSGISDLFHLEMKRYYLFLSQIRDGFTDFK